MAWATVEQVESITGVEVTTEQLAAAIGVIEIVTDRTTDADAAVTARDLGWLKRACAWQAVWQKSQPGIAERHSVSSIDQDGVSAQYRDEVDIYLAPLAKRCLKNLRWMGTQMISVATPQYTLPMSSPLAFNLEGSDDYHPWRVLR